MGQLWILNHFSPLRPTFYVKYKRNNFRLQEKIFRFVSISPLIWNNFVTFLIQIHLFQFFIFLPRPAKRNILCYAYCDKYNLCPLRAWAQKSRKTFTKKRYKIGLKKFFGAVKTPAKNQSVLWGVFLNCPILCGQYKKEPLVGKIEF